MAVPVIVGSLGRIPVGALTDRLAARRMFPTVQLAAAFAPSFPFDLIGAYSRRW